MSSALVDRPGKYEIQAEKLVEREGSIYILEQSINCVLFCLPFLGKLFEVYTFSKSLIYSISPKKLTVFNLVLSVLKRIIYVL